MKKHHLKKFIKNKYFIIGAVIVLLILFLAFRSGGANQNIEYAEAGISDVIEQVSVTGKVLPVVRADLAFEKGGVLKNIYKNVGDHVKKGETIASLDNDSERAALAAARAELADTSRGLRPEELGVEKAKLEGASTTLQNAKKDVLVSARDGYVEVQGAVFNYTDIFFNYPQSANPTINIATQSYSEKQTINNKRIGITEVLNKWKNDLALLYTNEKAGQLISNSENYLSIIKDYMNSLSYIVNNLNTSSTGLSQTTIDSYISSMNSGLSGLNQAISSVSNADASLKSANASYLEAKNNFDLKQAGSSAQSISAKQAKADQASADLSKTIIVSPVDGIVTKADPHIGEYVSAGQSGFAVQSDEVFNIEAYVPEADIAKIALDNKADITLDAYGQDVVFKAYVSAIDPAETVIEGVPTYKVTLKFEEKDERVRSGMTANIDILTHEARNVLSVPYRAIMDDKGAKSIRVLNKDGKTFEIVPVITGLKGTEGLVEIKSGINQGEKVVTYIKQ